MLSDITIILQRIMTRLQIALYHLVEQPMRTNGACCIVTGAIKGAIINPARVKNWNARKPTCAAHQTHLYSPSK